MDDDAKRNTDYPFACWCGEQHKTSEYARDCKKCRTYLMPDDYAKRTIYRWHSAAPGNGMWILNDDTQK